MSTDLTKTSSHIYWLWVAIIALGSSSLGGYLTLLARDECLAEKISTSEMTIKIQLAEIKTTLASVESTLLELKRDIKRREP